jgi:hypothetical protein
MRKQGSAVAGLELQLLGKTHANHDVCAELPLRRTSDGSWRFRSLTSGVIGLLTGPHHTSFEDESSLTIRLSDGERPVLAPEYADRAPDDVMAEPDS